MENKLKKNNSQKSFYFQNFINDENINNSSNSYSLFNSRANIVFKIFFFAFLVILLKLLYLGINKSNEISFDDLIADKDYNQRRDIIDRSRLLIAKNIDVYDLVLKVDKTNNLPQLLVKLKSQFPKLNIIEIQKESIEKKRLVIKKKLDFVEYKKAIMMGEPAVELSKRQVRIYPQRSLFSHILGQTDDDNKGISGIENQFNNQIVNAKFSDSSFQITIDALIQSQIRESLENAITDYSAKGAAALLMNVNSGEILSLVSLPDFDINHRTLINDEKYLNKITLGVYELGSSFKSLTIASALELKLIDENTLFKNLEKEVYNCGTANPIHEHEKNLKKDLTTTEILAKSSNIGTIKIVEKIGIENHKNFLTKMGIFEKSSIEIPEKGKSLPMKWDKCTLATASYGHGISTTPIQLASAYATLVNGGYKIYPTLIKQNQTNKKERIINEETSKKMVKMLRKVVDKDDPVQGTARKADISGYSVIGKTGTAVKLSKTSKGYSRDVLTVFVSAFPEEKPEYLLLVMIDEPKAKLSTGLLKSDAGWNAVPTAGKIIKRVGPILATKNYNIALNVK
jgi:cell division protein FtsI (penicillin-binding protein 3)